jgi:hypothetical protein
MDDHQRRVDLDGFVLLAERAPGGDHACWRIVRELLISGPPVYGNDWATGAEDPWAAPEAEWAASGRVTPDGCMDWSARVHHCAPHEAEAFASALSRAYPECLALLGR